MQIKNKNMKEWEEFKKEIEEKLEKGELTEEDEDYGIYLLYWLPMGIILYDRWREKRKRVNKKESNNKEKKRVNK